MHQILKEGGVYRIWPGSPTLNISQLPNQDLSITCLSLGEALAYVPSENKVYKILDVSPPSNQQAAQGAPTEAEMSKYSVRFKEELDKKNQLASADPIKEKSLLFFREKYYKFFKNNSKEDKIRAETAGELLVYLVPDLEDQLKQIMREIKNDKGIKISEFKLE